MVQRCNYLIDMLKEIDNGNEIIPDDEDFKLALHEVYSNKNYNKLVELVRVLTDIHLKKGKFENYLEAFEEAVDDLGECYNQVNEHYFNGKEKKNIQKFYKDSMKKFVEDN